MDRDPKFEIQYLLSVIIAVLGSLGSNSISQYVSKPTALLLLALIFLHIVVFNLVYTLRRATEFELSEVSALDTGNRLTLYAITGLFFYLLVSVVSVWILLEILPVEESERMPHISWFTYRTFFEYIVPGLVVAAMGGLGWRRIVPSLRQARDIEISVVPKEIEVFHDFDSTRPLHVNIQNKSSEAIEFTTIIQFPEEVEWRYRETTTGSGVFNDETEVPASGGHEPYNIELRYQGVERKTNEVDIIIVKGDDTYHDNVILTLEEY